jgi:hypothetical protein
MLVGLAYAVAQEHPRYEPIIIRRLAHSTVVYVTGWDGFRITLVPEAGTMRVRRIEFVEADAE